MADFRTIDDFEVAGKRVLLRADLNVPMQAGRVSDTTRLDRLAPTIKELVGKRARVILLSHFGRPKGGPDRANSLSQLVRPLCHTLGGIAVRFAPDCIGPQAETVAQALGDGEVALLENLRFHAGEEANDAAFAEALAGLGELYVNDAFSAAHRAHASIDRLARLLPAAAGRLMQAELEALGRALEHPQRPLAAIVGGSKISTKLELLGNLVARVDLLAIGGAMANTFLAAQGVAIGRSLAERDLAETARAIREKASARGCTLILPEDAVVASELKPGVAAATVPIGEVPADKMILDIGPASVRTLVQHLRTCRTLVWNGPVGAFETPPFDAGTTEIARAVAGLTQTAGLASIAGGGDTVAALVDAGVADRLSYVSTAGGAFLEWLEGKELPGVAALKRRA
ncbi:MAG: phosphoglycerate kinase [Proteobacteria bacterium]|nr:phosphoglycerate kinase [Pseudomonadota bacterium]MBI3496487.1 phosphoglycerate kinase [Pseudomonadota bacterium]